LPPEIPGLFSAEECRATARAIASLQQPDGAIPWEGGRHVDPWNHVEAAMALDVGGLHSAAERAYAWLAAGQRADGSWAAAYRGGAVEDASTDANFCAYVATGAWHHFLATADCAFLVAIWPVVERAVEFVLELQRPGGEVQWARDSAGRAWPGALITSSASILKSLECALAIARCLGHSRTRWLTAQRLLGDALATRPESFEPKDRYAMDWYYPVLAGAVRGEAADARLEARWEEFVVPGLGVRCVSDRPWVTVAETCELVLALDAIGRTGQARRVFSWIGHLRGEDGHYWTGVTFPEGELWPEERPTWTSASVLLAADALCAESRCSGLFKHPERGRRGNLVELPRAERPLHDVEGRLAALGGVLENVVDDQEAAS
jgi:hypothetical protein